MIQFISDLQDYLWPQGKTTLSAVPLGGLTNIYADQTAVAANKLTVTKSGDILPVANVNPVAAVLSPVPQVVVSNRMVYIVIGAIVLYFLVIK